MLEIRIPLTSDIRVRFWANQRNPMRVQRIHWLRAIWRSYRSSFQRLNYGQGCVCYHQGAQGACAGHSEPHHEWDEQVAWCAGSPLHVKWGNSLLTMFLGWTSKSLRVQGLPSSKDMDNFLWSMNHYFRGARIIDGAMWVSIASMFLVDIAWLWWHRKSNERSGEPITIWVQFQVELW